VACFPGPPSAISPQAPGPSWVNCGRNPAVRSPGGQLEHQATCQRFSYGGLCQFLTPRAPLGKGPYREPAGKPNIRPSTGPQDGRAGAAIPPDNLGVLGICSAVMYWRNLRVGLAWPGVAGFGGAGPEGRLRSNPHYWELKHLPPTINPFARPPPVFRTATVVSAQPQRSQPQSPGPKKSKSWDPRLKRSNSGRPRLPCSKS